MFMFMFMFTFIRTCFSLRKNQTIHWLLYWCSPHRQPHITSIIYISFGYNYLFIDLYPLSVLVFLYILPSSYSYLSVCISSMFEQKGESCSKMEIDFLGLNSSKRDGVLLEPEGSNKIDFADSDEGVEISLSLGTTTATTSLDSQKEIAGTPQKKSWEFPCENLIPSCSSSSSSSSSNNTLNNLAYYNRESAPLRTEQPTLVLVPSPVFLPSSTAGFPYNLTNLRNISHIPADPASLPILYSGCGNSLKDSLPKKADKTMYMATQAPTGYSSDVTKCTRGHIPTIAMARKVTLARFLEKRLHRMNQAGTKNLMGKLINATNSEVCNTSAVKCKKKKDYGTRERLQ